ncbi:MAG: hypothetical protein KF784_01235 [Fimbriimonadaceae bacterium]|nr:hypothetical protein [Fimbriimonadaceae bacterium]
MNAFLAMMGSISFFAGTLGQTPPTGSPGQFIAPKPRVVPIKITIRHADPWFVVNMLQGIQVQFPELSTLGIPGLLNPPAGQGLALFPGKFIVNPTDNSIWYYPEQK